MYPPFGFAAHLALSNRIGAVKAVQERLATALGESGRLLESWHISPGNRAIIRAIGIYSYL
jgi:hypothetical protein